VGIVVIDIDAHTHRITPWGDTPPHKCSRNRKATHMSNLDVPGARLYYETHGNGPLLLMVPGANGEADLFKRVTEHLATHYTVATTIDAAFPGVTSMGRRTTIIGWRLTPLMSGA